MMVHPWIGDVQILSCGKADCYFLSFQQINNFTLYPCQVNLTMDKIETVFLSTENLTSYLFSFPDISMSLLMMKKAVNQIVKMPNACLINLLDFLFPARRQLTNTHHPFHVFLAPTSVTF